VSSDIGVLRAEACAALGDELGAEVRLIQTGDCLTAPGVMASRVPPAPDRWRWLQADAGRSRRWSDSERSLLDSVANVLAAAEGRDASERHVRWVADHDALTGLANRRLLMEVLDGRRGEEQATTVLLLDLDGFKEVNDTHGHAAGDAVLVATAERLRQGCRDGDFVARLSGDEFVVMCPEELNSREQVSLVSRIREALSRPIATGGREVAVSASIGIATSEYGDTPGEVVRRADALMYEDKRSRAGHSSRRRASVAG
jgi:diguanylate cyclase (GGDEF)-like protein